MLDVSSLKENASASEIQDTLQAVKKRNEPLTLIEILTIIKTVIPVYPSLERESRDAVLMLISKQFTFMAQLVSFTASLPEGQAERKIFRKVMIDTLKNKSQCLYIYMGQSTGTAMQRNNFKALMFGSKLFNILSPEMDVVDYLNCLREQWQFMLDKRLDTELSDKVFGEFLIATLTLHPALGEQIFLDDLFLTGERYFHSMTAIVSGASALDQQRLLKSFIVPYLDLHINGSNMDSVVAVLKRLPLERIVDLPYILTLKSLVLQGCLISLVPAKLQAEIVSQLLGRFGRPDENVDETICQLLVLSFKHAHDPSLKSNMSSDAKLLDGVTARLMHKDHALRERTMYIAKIVTNGELKYESDFTISVPELTSPRNDSQISFSSLRNQSNVQAIEAPAVTQSKTRQLTLSEDSDDEEDEDAGSTRDIVFLKDLVTQYAKLNANKGTKPTSLLKKTVKLVRQKKDFPIEVSYYSPALLVSISSLNNNLEEENFEEWRINALVSVLVVEPERATDLLKILFTSELSLQQRMSLLSGLGLAARELRGYDDKTVLKPQYDFPSSRIPWDNQTETPPALVTSPEELSMGRVVWKSKKLLSDGKEPSTQNNFRQYARLFFYPLAHGWLDGIDLGNFTDLFKTHYLMTLKIVYQCAYPVHDYDTMTQLMEQITLDASRQELRL